MFEDPLNFKREEDGVSLQASEFVYCRSTASFLKPDISPQR